MLSSALSDGQEIETLEGSKLTVSIRDGVVKINDAVVSTADLESGNGIVHVIDGVLLPETIAVDVLGTSGAYRPAFAAALSAVVGVVLAALMW